MKWCHFFLICATNKVFAPVTEVSDDEGDFEINYERDPQETLNKAFAHAPSIDKIQEVLMNGFKERIPSDYDITAKVFDHANWLYPEFKGLPQVAFNVYLDKKNESHEYLASHPREGFSVCIRCLKHGLADMYSHALMFAVDKDNTFSEASSLEDLSEEDQVKLRGVVNKVEEFSNEIGFDYMKDYNSIHGSDNFKQCTPQIYIFHVYWPEELRRQGLTRVFFKNVLALANEFKDPETSIALTAGTHVREGKVYFGAAVWQNMIVNGQKFQVQFPDLFKMGVIDPFVDYVKSKCFNVTNLWPSVEASLKSATDPSSIDAFKVPDGIGQGECTGNLGHEYLSTSDNFWDAYYQINGMSNPVERLKNEAGLNKLNIHDAEK